MRFLLLLLLPLVAHAFPDHLLGPVGCSTELSTDEIIMNNLVLPYEDSRDTDITVAVKTEEGSLLTSPLSITSVPVTFTLTVLNPNDVGDVQYVMDTTAGKFDYGQCDGAKRVTGRAGVTHKLVIDTMPEEPIEVWAGWATGHEAVMLTNKFLFEKDMPAAADVEAIVQEVKELEKAEEKEREDVQQDLGDDDVANVGDLEDQLDKMNASGEMKRKMEKVFENRAKWKDKDNKRGFHMKDIDKYKDMIQDKKKKHLPGMDVNWDEVKQRLAKDAKFAGKEQHAEKMAEHKRMMAERREKMMKTHPEGLSNKLKDLAHRDDRWKERLQEKREMLLGKARAPHPADTEEGAADEEPIIQRRAREIYEEQESDIVVKEFLIGLLGLLVANWFVLQICLWSDKKRKGRRTQ
mmetsp:Transcript_13237/g.21921  ORF Transcript_13237/g.21921 Transcript_13237/m.21921 type:complete len:407 (+) Transcript_13237:32-1252(+)|eukprot:CAMPEP_0119032696 /NCGR_PEP_ID=MMETSP1176-20130426/42181_1 /TAXON_ID=265551 /ORGANISM="Synedropsis recta cf, Strain CCMP1620" /LENGTH=406 /DNA_ID=CAMNT_0006989111 /DNA_START=19 /DNA_END=1239 /DNA_ORIENTATION=+